MDNELLAETLANLPPGFNFDISYLIAGFVFGIVGLWIFRRGRKQTNNRLVVIGLLLMIYPCFVYKAVWTWAVGAILSGGAYYYWNE